MILFTDFAYFLRLARIFKDTLPSMRATSSAAHHFEAWLLNWQGAASWPACRKLPLGKCHVELVEPESCFLHTQDVCTAYGANDA